MNFPASSIADLQAALALSNPTEADLRAAFNGNQPIFWDNVDNMGFGSRVAQQTSLNLGGALCDAAFTRANTDLNAFAVIGSDLNFLHNGDASCLVRALKRPQSEACFELDQRVEPAREEMEFQQSPAEPARAATPWLAGRNIAGTCNSAPD